jgi:NADPH-dependent 2,4-dienoyl-CoA reductase/sulfur reductase-like enzyme
MEFVVNFLIIGAGPAGMSAAIEIAARGERVVLFDDALFPGGPVFRHDEKNFKDNRPPGREKLRRKKLFEEFNALADLIDVKYSTTVLGIWKNNEVLYTSAGKSGIIHPRQIIIATGAYERPMPFPGWTLPGVMTAGGAKTFINSMHVRPGIRALISGTGPMLINVANRVHETGVEVIAVLEAGNPEYYTPAFIETWKETEFVKDIVSDIDELKKNGIPLIQNHGIFEAQGQAEVTGVLYGPLNKEDWSPIKENAITDDADLVILGYGFIPDSSLSSLAGCAHSFKDGIGWCVDRDHYMQTSVPGIFSVGDCAEIGGMIIAENEGRIAGIKALENMDLINAKDTQESLEKPLSEMLIFNKNRKILNDSMSARKGLLHLMRDETLVCRCEEVNLSSLKNAIEKGARDLQAVKLYTRLGMGPCQGRNCASSAGRYMCQNHQITPEEVGRINLRPPIRSVTLGALAGMIDDKK